MHSSNAQPAAPIPAGRALNLSRGEKDGCYQHSKPFSTFIGDCADMILQNRALYVGGHGGSVPPGGHGQMMSQQQAVNLQGPIAGTGLCLWTVLMSLCCHRALCFFESTGGSIAGLDSTIGPSCPMKCRRSICGCCKRPLEGSAC